MKFLNLTIKETHKGLIEKEFSCLELTKSYLNKIKKENKKLNTFLTLTDKLALDQAKKVDEKIACQEKIGALEGTPMAIKDNILVEGYIRKLSPIECERLQTLPDNYSEGISDNQRYKALGNGWTIDVIAHIFKGL